MLGVNFDSRAYLGSPKSPRALEQIKPGLHQALGLCSPGLALSLGSRAWVLARSGSNLTYHFYG